ncbi:hypothetical protein PENTCL1PPCAC_11228, partial [Pristionchus entomophagus]
LLPFILHSREMIGALIIVAALAIYIYSYYENSRHYWSRKKVPGPPSQLLTGNLRELWYTDTPRVLVLRDWTKKYGKVYGMHEGQRKVLVVSDIDMLNEILVKKFDNFQARMRFPLQRPDEGPKTHIVEASGARWKRLRTLGTFGFTNKALKQVRDTVEESSLLVVRELETKMEKGEVNMLEFFQEYTMDIICKIALGQKDVEMFNNKYLQICKDVFMSPINNILNVIPSAFPFIQKPLFNFIEFAGKHLKIPFVELMIDLERAVAERKKQREAGQESSSADFIDIYLDAEIDGGENDDVEGSRRLVFDEIVSQCMVMLLAGFETTSNSLSYLTHFLANYPDVQEKMRDEIDREITGEIVEYDSLVNLKYTESVIRESLRHYPLASFVVNRECVKATEVCGHQLEEGDMIMTDSWSLHMDKEIWGEDAEEFRPERWLEESSRPRVAFQSFGEGPRMCIGMRLAYMEEKIVLAHLMKNFVIRKSQNTNPLELVGPLTVSPSRVMVRLERRI